MTKTRRKVEWEIPQGKNPKYIHVIVRETGNLGTNTVRLSKNDLERSLGLLEYVTSRRDKE